MRRTKQDFTWIENNDKPCGYLRNVRYKEGEYCGDCAISKTKCVTPHENLQTTLDCVKGSLSNEVTFEMVVQCLWENVPKKRRSRALNAMCDGCSGYDNGCENYIADKTKGD